MLSSHHILASTLFHVLAVADVAKQACLSTARRAQRLQWILASLQPFRAKIPRPMFAMRNFPEA
jgi:hypothetical protein